MNSKSRHFTGNSMALKKKKAFFFRQLFSQTAESKKQTAAAWKTTSSVSVLTSMFHLHHPIHPSSSYVIHQRSTLHSRNATQPLNGSFLGSFSFFPASISGRNISHTIARSSERNKPDKVHMSLTFHLQCRQMFSIQLEVHIRSYIAWAKATRFL